MIARLKFIDYDARREPKTAHWCVCCQRDLNPLEAQRYVFVTGDYEAVHPQDLQHRPPLPSDFGWRLIGRSCARKLGFAWTTEAPSSADG